MEKIFEKIENENENFQLFISKIAAALQNMITRISIFSYQGSIYLFLF